MENTENTLAQDMTLDDKVRNWLCRIIFIATSCLYLYTAGFGSLDEMVQRCLLVLVAGFAVFLTKPFTIKGKRNTATRILDWLFAIAIIVACVYIMSVWPARSVSTKAKPPLDSIMGTIMIVVLLVATYKTTGWPLVITCVVFLVYALLGPYMPGFLAHRGYTWKRVAETMYVSTQAIFGVPAGIAATYIVCFVIFGSFLETFGAGQWFVDIAFAGAGRFRGGPAKTAILSSALMGMISGSPAANVVTTGTFTIPLMKRMGFKPHVAGAVEAVASTGGMFTPPIMGAAAFMMAEFLNVKYSTVAAAAILPAVLYYISALLVVDSISVKEHLLGLPRNELPSVKSVMKERGLMGLPILMIIVVILMGWSPMKAAFWATLLTLALSFVSPATRPTVSKIFEALESGTKSVASIAISCASAGIIVGIHHHPGLRHAPHAHLRHPGDLPGSPSDRDGSVPAVRPYVHLHVRLRWCTDPAGCHHGLYRGCDRKVQSEPDRFHVFPHGYRGLYHPLHLPAESGDPTGRRSIGSGDCGSHRHCWRVLPDWCH